MAIVRGNGSVLAMTDFNSVKANQEIVHIAEFQVSAAQIRLATN
jgi:hypothetical protein